MKLGVIGYGSRIRNMLQSIVKYDSDCRIAAIVDVRNDEFKRNRENNGLDKVNFYDTPEEMIAGEELDGILIGTRCSLHTEMALKVMPSGIPLFLEKPVATNMDDLRRLKQGYESGKSKVLVSFPLSLTSMVNMVKEIIQSGKIGTVEHVQAVNNVPYGGIYYHNWYRDENETGGMFLQKATHDFDYITDVLQLRPISISAMTSKRIFTGTKPAGLKCVDCDENRTCEESTAFADKETRDTWAYCCFAKDTGNEDSGSALIRYESGMHATYSQNFFVRRGAAARGARFMGYKGTIEFDFFTNQIKVFMHHTARVETYDIDPGEEHFGGDAALAANFVAMMRNGADPIRSLGEGLLSGLLCLKARESSRTDTFQTIDWE